MNTRGVLRDCRLLVTDFTSDAEELKSFIDSIPYDPDMDSHNFSLDNYFPMPDEVAQKINKRKASDMDDWYGWRIANWGVPYDVEHKTIHFNSGSVLIDFFSLGGVPEPAISRLSWRFPKLRFLFSFMPVEGTRESGFALYERGRLLASKYREVATNL